MKKFRFKAKDNKGVTVTGVVEAMDTRSAAGVLRERGLTVVKLTDAGSNFLTAFIERFTNKITLHDLTTFTRQLSTMTTAGLQLTNSLSILRSQAKKSIGEVIVSVQADVAGGSALADALAKHPRVFNRTYVALVRAGEAAGVLDEVLERLADNLEKREEFLGKVKGALIYPAIVIAGMIIVGFIMMVFVVPAMVGIYQELEVDLPLPTKILIGVSNLFSGWWWAILILAGIGGFFLIQYIKTPQGRRTLDEWSLKIPVAGKLLKTSILTEIARTMALMTKSGISIIDALNIVAESAGNSLYEADLKQLSKQVEKGLPMALSLADNPLYPMIVPQMVGVGEETGKIDEVFAKLSRYFEVEAEQLVKGLTTAIEPIVLVIMGAGVFFLALAVVLPIYSLTDSF